MTLEQIRKAKSWDDLKPACIYLLENMNSQTFGEFHAYRNTIAHKAEEFGLNFTELNNQVEHWDIHGEWPKEGE